MQELCEFKRIYTASVFCTLYFSQNRKIYNPYYEIIEKELKMKNKLKKVKEWASDHSDELYVGGIIAASFAVCALAYAGAVKTQKEYTNTVEEAIRSGKTILPNPDGSLWILDLN